MNPRTALIVVDMQNDFVDPKGSLYVKNAEKLIDPINSLIYKCLAEGIDVIVTKDWHPKNHVSFASNHKGGKLFEQVKLADGTPQTLWPTHCVQNTWGSELHPALCSHPKLRPLNKGTEVNVDSYSAFYDNNQVHSTGLTNFLRNDKITNVLVCGVALDFCVKSTALDALKDGFKTTLLTDLTLPVNISPDDGEKAIKAIIAAGGTVQANYTIHGHGITR